VEEGAITKLSRTEEGEEEVVVERGRGALEEGKAVDENGAAGMAPVFQRQDRERMVKMQT
jgi:hypothetical protein